jgi:hypothetical protein
MYVFGQVAIACANAHSSHCATLARPPWQVFESAVLAELAVIQATSSLAMARVSAQRLLALGTLAVRHDAPSGVDSIVRALCRLALCVPRSQSLPEHVVQGCVDPALRLAQDNLGALRPSTWRLLIDLLLRTRCGGSFLCAPLSVCMCLVPCMLVVFPSVTLLLWGVPCSAQ